MKKTLVVIVVSFLVPGAGLACLGLSSGCGGIGLAYQKHLSGKYSLIATDILEQMCISEPSGPNGWNGVIPQTVFAVGWDDRFIVAKQHPNKDHLYGLDKTITNYYILRVSDGHRTGPLDEASFKAERSNQGVPESLAFTLVFDHLK